jgi:hypothetical protein
LILALKVKTQLFVVQNPSIFERILLQKNLKSPFLNTNNFGKPISNKAHSFICLYSSGSQPFAIGIPPN